MVYLMALRKGSDPQGALEDFARCTACSAFLMVMGRGFPFQGSSLFAPSLYSEAMSGSGRFICRWLSAEGV